jgi:hypothetical protein
MKRLRLWILLGAVVLLSAPAVFATSSSPNYRVNETQFDSGGLLNGTSANYQAQQSLGSTGAGSSCSATYCAEAGFLTGRDPFLEMVVNSATINLGTLSSVSAATGTATFHIRAYLDSGYTVLSMNDPPVNEEGVFLNALSSPTASTVGAEQYGINLVQNQTTCPTPAPVNFGANPVLVPSSTFANGIAATGYDTCGLFKYHKGDVVAQSNGKGWGETDYTISYLVNINAVSKAGSYNMTQDLVAVATY